MIQAVFQIICFNVHIFNLISFWVELAILQNNIHVQNHGYYKKEAALNLFPLREPLSLFKIR